MTSPEKTDRAKKEYRKPQITKVSLKPSSTTLGTCWSLILGAPNEAECQTASGCFIL